MKVVLWRAEVSLLQNVLFCTTSLLAKKTFFWLESKARGLASAESNPERGRKHLGRMETVGSLERCF